MKKIAILAIGVLALVGAGCSSGSSGSTEKSTGKAAVTEGEMFLHASATQVGRDVTFRVTNDGKIHHEFVIVRGNPAGTKGDEAGRVSEAGHIGGEEVPEIGDIAPGQTKVLSVTLPPGTYTMMCNLPGHFVDGMHQTFVVH